MARRPSDRLPHHAATPQRRSAETSPSRRPVSRKRRLGLSITAIVLLPIVFFLLLEGALRVTRFGYPTTFFLKTANGTLTTNPKFAWQFYPRETATSPTPLRVAKAKPTGTKRIVVLGESAAAGTPDPAFSFSRILELMLAEQYPGQPVEVINAAMRGIDSHIVRKIARECVQLSPDAFVIYMGNNELIGLHSPDPSKPAFVSHPNFVRIQTAAKSLKTAQLIGSMLQLARAGKAKSAQDMDFMRRQATAFDDPRRAPIYAAYRENLEGICDLARKAGARVIVSTVAVNLRDFPPLQSRHRGDLTPQQRNRWENHYSRGSEAEYTRQPELALHHFRAAAQIDGHYAELIYRMARSEDALGRHAEAKAHYSQARDLDALQFRSDSRINSIVREVAAHAGTNQVRFVDVEQALAASEFSEHGIPGEILFQEHVHFYFEGDYAVARALLPHVGSAIGMQQRQGSVLAREECARRLAYTSVEAANIVAAVAQLTSKPPFLDRLEHENRLRVAQHRAREALSRLTAELASESKATYDKAIQARPHDWMLRYNYARLLTDIGNHAEALPHYEYVARQFPHQRTFRHMYGVALYNAQRANDAATEFHAALKIDPKFEPAKQALDKLRRK